MLFYTPLYIIREIITFSYFVVFFYWKPVYEMLRYFVVHEEDAFAIMRFFEWNISRKFSL